MEIKDSKGIIKIRFDGFVSCLFIHTPRLVDWPDCGGSVGRYFACLPFDEADKVFQNEMENKVSSVRSIDDLKNSGFLEVLEDGEYDFELWEEKETDLVYNTNLLNSNGIVHAWHKNQIGEQSVAKPYPLDSFYPYGRQLMFTQPFETLDVDRIRYYENKILNGERPLAIALRAMRAKQDDEESYQETYYNTAKYVLDGHHKLVAYKNLNVKPSCIIISRVQSGLLSVPDESALPGLDSYLFYYQIEHIITNGIDIMHSSKDLAKYIDDFIQKTSRVEDTMARTLIQCSKKFGNESNEERRKWFEERLSILINRIEKNETPFYLNYYCRKDFFMKRVQVKKWKEVVELVN